MHSLRKLLCVFVFVWAHFVGGCCGPLCQQLNHSEDLPQFTGGGVDPLIVSLPFEAGYTSRCVQGASGSTSHRSRSTLYDVDLDTPNDVNDLVFAPVSGTAYVHDAEPGRNFGIHINIDQGDGTYVVMAHLAATFVDSGSQVAAGQLIGFEGSTGNSSGDHVHFGRHDGDASLDAVYGTSVNGLVIDAMQGGTHVQLATSDMVCDLPDGYSYTSILSTPLWHPNGSLVKTPYSSAIYLLQSQTLVPFYDDDAFVSYNYSFTDVSLISESEYSCYYRNDPHPPLLPTGITAVYGAGTNEGVWLLVGGENEEEHIRYRLQVPEYGWQAVLKSWGINVSTYDDLVHDVDFGGLVRNYRYGGVATFRDGSLISPVGDSAVYVMSDGIAMPINTWDTLLLAGWEDRRVIEVADGEFESVVTTKGDCQTNIHCLTREDVVSCGGELQENQGVNDQIAEGDTLILTWFAPDDQEVDSITLVGAVTRSGGVEESWGSVFNEVLNASQMSVYLPDLASGDSFRFSVEYRDNGVSSWSCLAPYPPGITQGSVTANYGGVYLGYTPADDPGSEGCGLKVDVP